MYTLPWLEQRGYDVTYSTDVDAEVNPGHCAASKVCWSRATASTGPQACTTHSQLHATRGLAWDFWGPMPFTGRPATRPPAGGWWATRPTRPPSRSIRLPRGVRR